MNARALTLPAPLADLRQRAAVFWQGLGVRDRRMLRLAGVLVGLLILWLLGIQPALRAVRELPPQIARVDLELQHMQALAAESKTLRAAPPVTQAQAAAAVRAAAARLGERVRVVQQGERMNLTLSGVDPTALSALLAELRASARARPLEAQLTRGAKGFDGTLAIGLGSAS